MILVVLGTQDKRFERLLKVVEEAIDQGVIKEEVMVQAGCTVYNSSKMNVVDYVDMTTFEQWMKDCRLLITHGGVGTIMSALRNKKPVIACARLAKYGEHHNDHQCEIIETFYEKGYLIPLRDGQSLKEALSEVENFVVPEVESNNHKMIELLANYLEI